MLRVSAVSVEPHPTGQTMWSHRDGNRRFARVMHARLRKLGIKETDPERLSTEERSKCAHLTADQSGRGGGGGGGHSNGRRR